MDRLPSELVNRIVDLTEEPYIAYILGIEPDRETLFLGGGILISLEKILTLGGDMKALMFMKKYIPPYLAIYKAVCCINPKMVIRVCLIWNSWTSNLGYSMSFEKRFKWGIDNIKHDDIFVTQAMYIRNNMLDRLVLEDGISPNVDIDDIANSNLSEYMYDMCIRDDPMKLAVAKILRGIYKEDLSLAFIDNVLDNMEYHKINYVCHIIRALMITNRFDDAISIFDKYRYDCDTASYEFLSITSIAVRERILDFLEYINVEHIEVYKVLMDMEDSRKIDNMDRSVVADILFETGILCDPYDVELFEEGEIRTIEDAIYGCYDDIGEVDITRSFELNGSKKNDIIWLINRYRNAEHVEMKSNIQRIGIFMMNKIVYYPNMEKNIYVYNCHNMYMDKPYSPDICVAYWMYYGNGVIRN
ncbi:hypothetical protein BJ944DRAFT_258746, partial [Cunninghamella echinulata]